MLDQPDVLDQPDAVSDPFQTAHPAYPPGALRRTWRRAYRRKTRIFAALLTGCVAGEAAAVWGCWHVLSAWF